jgi:lipid-A-disaccharide synthase-like uncharacterized protein
MASYLGYILLGAGVLVFLITWFDKSRKSLPLMFAATMMVMGGLAILQYLGSDGPSVL